MNADDGLRGLLEKTRAKLSGLDFSEENAKIEELNEQKREHDAAIADLDGQLLDVGQKINAKRDSDGEELADAVLAGESSAVAEAMVPSIDTLRDRRVALQKARHTLLKRKESIGRTERDLQGLAREKMNEVLAPLVAELSRRQKLAAQEVADIHAAIQALDFEGRGFTLERFVSRNSVEGGLFGMDSILGLQSELPVPKVIIETLASVSAKTPLIKGSVPDKFKR